MDIVMMTYYMSEKLPKQEKYGLRSQLTRAAISITANIAEGSGRISDKDNRRFLDYALGSSYEMETLLLVMKNCDIGDECIEVTDLLEMVKDEQKMIIAFQKRLS